MQGGLHSPGVLACQASNTRMFSQSEHRVRSRGVKLLELDDDIAWAVIGRTAVMLKPVVPEQLDPAAANAVLGLGEHPRVRSLAGEDPGAVQAALHQLRALAASATGVAP